MTNYHELMPKLIELETWRDVPHKILLLYKEKLFRTRENSGWYNQPYGDGYICIRKNVKGYSVEFNISSIDDQSLNAYVCVETYEEALRIYSEILGTTSEWTHIPTKEQWQNLLWYIGLYDNSN